jgi:hypothetical protein
LPCTGQLASASRIASQGALSIHRDVRQAKSDRRRRRRLQSDVESGDAAAVCVDGDREPWPADRFSIDRVDHDQVHGRVVDLHQVKRMLAMWGMAMRRLCFGMLLAAATPVGDGQHFEPVADRAR